MTAILAFSMARPSGQVDAGGDPLIRSVRRQERAFIGCRTIPFVYLLAFLARAHAAGGSVLLLTAATSDEEQMRSLEAAVREAAATTGLQVATERVAQIQLADVLGADGPEVAPSATTRVARLWIDATSGSSATLYLTDGERRRVYVRQVPLERGRLDRVALESISLIVEKSLKVLVAGQEIGVSRTAFTGGPVAPSPAPLGEHERGESEASPPPAPLPAPAPPRHRQAAVSAGYEFLRAAPLPAQHRFVLAYQWRATRMRADASGYAAIPQTIDGVPAGARLFTSGLRLTAGAHWGAPSSVELSAGTGLGVEAVRVEPQVGVAGFRAIAPFWAGALSLRACALLEHQVAPLGGGWIVGLLAGVEIYPSRERYLIGDASGTQLVVEGPHWRPVVGLLIGSRI